MNQINPYLFFDGDCRQAMTFYQQCLGGELQVMTYADAGIPSAPEHRDRVIHAHLKNEAMVVMASDTMPPDARAEDATFDVGNNVYLNLDCGSAAEVDALYPALAEGGRASAPPHDPFWGGRHGRLVDRFGIRWMLNSEQAGQG